MLGEGHRLFSAGRGRDVLLFPQPGRRPPHLVPRPQLGLPQPRLQLCGPGQLLHKLKLVPKSGADTGYSSLYMWVNRDTWVFDRIDFYDSTGLVKRMTSGSVEVRDGYTTLGALLMVNQKTGHKTRITISSVEYDTGLESSFFSQRELKK
ncbi:MAG: outer membrane lipoprotein-sorting protein [bacterium]|nr:outer membrane lipoprotein-sorting protein [bacterium]